MLERFAEGRWRMTASKSRIRGLYVIVDPQQTQGRDPVAVARLAPIEGGDTIVVIDDLFTEPGARSVGVGEAMLAVIVEWGTDRGAVGIDAVVLPGARETKNFFESFGLKARALVVHRDLP